MNAQKIIDAITEQRNAALNSAAVAVADAAELRERMQALQAEIIELRAQQNAPAGFHPERDADRPPQRPLTAAGG